MALYSTTTRDQFKEKVLENKNLVLVDFWAEWCPPCRMMAPILEKVAKEMNGVDVVKVDIEASAENNQLASENSVQSIPNMKVFKDGQLVKELIGARPQSVLEQELKSLL